MQSTCPDRWTSSNLHNPEGKLPSSQKPTLVSHSTLTFSNTNLNPSDYNLNHLYSEHSPVKPYSCKMILSPGITFLPLMAQLPVVILHGFVSSLGPCLSLPLYHMLLKGRDCVWSGWTFVGPSVWGPIQNENGKSRFKNDKEFQDGNNRALNQAQVLLSTVPFQMHRLHTHGAGLPEQHRCREETR